MREKILRIERIDCLQGIADQYDNCMDRPLKKVPGFQMFLQYHLLLCKYHIAVTS